MQTIQIVNKLTRVKVNLETENVVLDAISIVHAKIDKSDVSELLQEGNTLIVKKKNGQRLVVENFYVKNGILHIIIIEY